jgi:hypothetical protein
MVTHETRGLAILERPVLQLGVAAGELISTM